jgi:hypothetical protein
METNRLTWNRSRRIPEAVLLLVEFDVVATKTTGNGMKDD